MKFQPFFGDLLARTNRDSNGKVVSFEITDDDAKKLEEAFAYYQKLMKFFLRSEKLLGMVC